MINLRTARLQQHGRTGKGLQVLLGRLEGKRILEELGMDGKIILQWILRKRCELDSYGSGFGPGWNYSEFSNEMWGVP
jgi:hypothetical protein